MKKWQYFAHWTRPVVKNNSAFALVYLKDTVSTAMKAGEMFQWKHTLVCLSNSQDDSLHSSERTLQQSTHADSCELVLSLTSSQETFSRA